MVADQTRQTGRAFRVGLLIVMAPFLAVNLFMLAAGNLLSVVPVLVQLPLVVTLIRNQRRQVFFAKLWSAILVIGGACGWLNTICNLLILGLDRSQLDDSAFLPSELILNTTTLVVGSFVFVKCKNGLSTPIVRVRTQDATETK